MPPNGGLATWPDNLDADSFGADAAAVLTNRERIVLVLRFGLDGGPKLSLRQVGTELGIGGERVRQLQRRAIDKLEWWQEVPSRVDGKTAGPRAKAITPAAGQAGRNVRRCRMRTGTPRAEIAFRSGLDRNYLCDIEDGRKQLGLATIARLTSALDVPPSELLAGIEWRTGGKQRGSLHVHRRWVPA